MPKKRRGESKRFRVNYEGANIDILLFNSANHYEWWWGMGNNLKPEEREEVIKTGEYIPHKFLVGRTIKGDDCLMDDGQVGQVGEVLQRVPVLIGMPEKFKIDPSWLKTPEIINSQDLTMGKFLEIKKKYTLYESEKKAEQCPFCRIHPRWIDLNNIFESDMKWMRILSPKRFSMFTLEKGGIMAPCICLSEHLM